MCFNILLLDSLDECEICGCEAHRSDRWEYCYYVDLKYTEMIIFQRFRVIYWTKNFATVCIAHKADFQWLTELVRLRFNFSDKIIFIKELCAYNVRITFWPTQRVGPSIYLQYLFRQFRLHRRNSPDGRVTFVSSG